MPAFFCLSDLNIAIVESSYINTVLLSGQMNPRGRKSISGKPDVKPLYAHFFLDQFLPSEMLSDKRWSSVYRSGESGTYLTKLMNGTADGLSVHRRYMNELATFRYKITRNSDYLFLDIMSKRCDLFLQQYASEKEGEGTVDMAETLRYWKQETNGSAQEVDKNRLSREQQSFVSEVEEYCRNAPASKAMASMMLLGLLAGLFERDGDLVHAWLDELHAWRLAGFPDHYTNHDVTETSFFQAFPINEETVSGKMYQQIAGFLRPDNEYPLFNSSIQYLLPALGALMTWRGITRIGHKAALSFLSDPETVSVLHLDVLTEYRSTPARKNLEEAFQILCSLGLLISERQTYRFADPQMLKFCCALHSLNLFDIEVKESVFIPSDYPYDAHTDLFWQLFSRDTLHYYEELLPQEELSGPSFAHARLYLSWSIIIFYGNGADEPGCCREDLPEAERRQHMLQTLWRSAMMLRHVVEAGVFPCAAWNYAFYLKRIAEILETTEDADKERERIENLYTESYAAVRRIVALIDLGEDVIDNGFAKKHIYDKYAQFLLQKCYPIKKADALREESSAFGSSGAQAASDPALSEEEEWIVPGYEGLVPDQRMNASQMQDEIIRVLRIASDNMNTISMNRLGLLLMKNDTDKDYITAFHLFQKSALLGDLFARGMVCELLLDHHDALSREFLSLQFTPSQGGTRPYTVSQAVSMNLLPDCCIGYIRYAFNEDTYETIISDSRKSRYATMFHQLGRCYKMKGDRENALKYLQAAAAMDWSQNDNEGEYDRLLNDLRLYSRLSAVSTTNGSTQNAE